MLLLILDYMKAFHQKSPQVEVGVGVHDMHIVETLHHILPEVLDQKVDLLLQFLRALLWIIR